MLLMLKNAYLLLNSGQIMEVTVVWIDLTSVYPFQNKGLDFATTPKNEYIYLMYQLKGSGLLD